MQILVSLLGMATLLGVAVLLSRGMKLALNVGAMLLAFIGLIAVVNLPLSTVGGSLIDKKLMVNEFVAYGASSRSRQPPCQI